MGTLASSEDPDEMPNNAAFHQGMHCLLKQKQSSEKEIQFFLEIITCNHPDLIACYFMESSIGLKMVKKLLLV